jgi:hypothetical protein
MATEARSEMGDGRWKLDGNPNIERPLADFDDPPLLFDSAFGVQRSMCFVEPGEEDKRTKEILIFRLQLALLIDR